MRLAFVVALLGALGSLCRYLADLKLSALLGRELPWGTMVVNVVGSGLAGLLLGTTGFQSLSPTLATLYLVGFLGGFTTASTFAYETARLIEARRLGAAVFVTLGTMASAVVAGLLGLWLGSAL